MGLILNYFLLTTKQVCRKDHLGRAIALHDMYESAFSFISILKQTNLYIVDCVQCIWDITAYFLLPELKYYYEKSINRYYTFGCWR